MGNFSKAIRSIDPGLTLSQELALDVGRGELPLKKI